MKNSPQALLNRKAKRAALKLTIDVNSIPRHITKT